MGLSLVVGRSFRYHGRVVENAELEQWLIDALADASGLRPGEVDVDASLAELGVDSLSSVSLLSGLQAVTGKLVPVEALIVYPTVRQLCEQLSRDDWDDRLSELYPAPPALERLRAETPGATLNPEPSPDEPWAGETILVTGATGVVGARVVVALLESRTCSIICLVRARTPAGGRRRLQRFLRAYGYEADLAERIEVVCGDVAQDRLGLTESEEAALTDRVDLVIHCAARVSLSAPHAEVAPVNVEGTERVCALALATKTKAMVLASSYSLFGDRLAQTEVDYDERSFEVGQRFIVGYMRSKLEAEEVVRRYGALGLRWRIARIGDVIGDSKTGRYPLAMATEQSLYVELLSIYARLGLVPDAGGWLATPVDAAALGLVHLAFHASKSGLVYHVFPDARVMPSAFAQALTACGIEARVADPFEVGARAMQLDDGARALAFLQLAQGSNSTGLGHARASTRPADWSAVRSRETTAVLTRDGVPSPSPDQAALVAFIRHAQHAGVLPEGARDA